MNPNKINKYLYINKSPNWLIMLVNAVGIITWSLVVYGYWDAIKYDAFFRWIIAPILAVFTAYYFLSYGMNLFYYRRLKLSNHKKLMSDYWENNNNPSVDIYLPICGENIELLENTWKNVALLNYSNKKVYVLDDSKSGNKENQELAEKYNFNYLSRPDKGKMKKAGNLKYAYSRSNGEFIIIFDADFAPHKEFVEELLPYMKDEKVGIVQSPQYFEMSNKIHKRSPLEYGAAYVQEAFYRYIQVSRDYFGGSICCGSNAIYRRNALDSIGGPVQIEHSEDAITGFTLTDAGWKVKYVPIILAVGVCPDDLHAYFHQQHRWCTGSMTLLLMKKFWKSKISWATKSCYFMGFLYYISNLLAILFSFQLFYSLFMYNDYISLSNGLLFYPYMIYNIILMLIFPLHKFKWGCFLTRFVQMYSYSHAAITTFMKTTVGWIPTNTKHSGVSKAFSQATIAIYIYIFIYLSISAIALHKGYLKLLNYNYYSLQFWIIYNTFFTSFLLYYMVSTMRVAKKMQFKELNAKKGKYLNWQVKIIGIPALLLIFMFIGIMLW